MTLLHTALAARAAALRASETSPWPAGTLVTPDDVLVSGTSLTGLAIAVGTPALLAGGVVDGQRRRGAVVVVVRVDAVIPPLHRPHEVWVDAEIDGCAPVLSAVRLLGRPGSGRTARYRMRPDRSGVLAPLVRLPADLRRHDLLAIPCATCFGLEDIER